MMGAQPVQLRTTCPTCMQEVSLVAWQVTLTDFDYRFTCPACGPQTKPVNDRIVGLLLAGRVVDVRGRPDVGPLTQTEVDRFCDGLCTSDLLAAVCERETAR